MLVRSALRDLWHELDHNTSAINLMNSPKLRMLRHAHAHFAELLMGLISLKLTPSKKAVVEAFGKIIYNHTQNASSIKPTN